MSNSKKYQKRIDEYLIDLNYKKKWIWIKKNIKIINNRKEKKIKVISKISENTDFNYMNIYTQKI